MSASTRTPGPNLININFDSDEIVSKFVAMDEDLPDSAIEKLGLEPFQIGLLRHKFDKGKPLLRTKYLMQIAETLEMEEGDLYNCMEQHPFCHRIKVENALEVFNFVLGLKALNKPKEQIRNCIYIMLYSKQSIEQAFYEAQQLHDLKDYLSTSLRVLDMIIYLIERREAAHFQQKFFGLGIDTSRRKPRDGKQPNRDCEEFYPDEVQHLR